jgi:gp45 sliding clamp, C terminal
MNFSEKTLAVLKNFASINSGVVFRPGKIQKSMDANKQILVEATLEDDFPSEFGVYDLNNFLGNVTSLKNPNLNFTKEWVSLEEGDFNLTYMACPSNLIITPPEKELVLKSVDVKFTLTNANFSRLLKLATMNSLPHISVVGKDGSLLLKIHDKTNDTSNHGASKIGEYAGEDFTATFKAENLKLLPDDYEVELQKGAFAKFVNTAGNLKYFVSVESK